eukprot:gene39381-47937_t
MPNYSYSPLAQDPNSRPPRVDPQDDFNKKRDICLGFLILSAIVYVLARASAVQSACKPLVAELSGPSETGMVSTAAAPAGGFDIASYRKNMLSKTPPHIIECAEADEGGSQE